MAGSRPTTFAIALVAAWMLLPLPGLRAAPEDPAPGAQPSGPVYQNDELGIRATGPVGWKMAADKGKASPWTRVVTFFEPVTDSDAVLSVRRRTSATLAQLMVEVKKDWLAEPDLVVTNIRMIQPTELQPQAAVVVDGTYLQRKKPKPDDTGPPPPAVTMRVSATYFLAPKSEFLLYATAQATHWSRVRAALDRLRASVAFEAERVSGPRGEGAYRSDLYGFSCRFPKDYTVVQPQRRNHVLQLEGLSAEDAVLGVYHLRFNDSVEADANRLVRFYQEDLGGTATVASLEVSGKSGLLVTARATVGGREQVLLFALVKRGSDEVFRLRAAIPKEREADGQKLFAEFASNFKLGPAPR